MNMDANAL